MKKLLLLMSVAFAAVLSALEPVPAFTAWKKDGAGEFKVTEKSAVVTFVKGNRPAALKYKLAVDPDGYYVFTGKFKRNSVDSVPQIDFVSRNAKNQWLGQYFAPKVKEAPVGEWQNFEIRAYLNSSTAFADITVGSFGGSVEIKDLAFTKKTIHDRPANAPAPEYWVNMDWWDNVYYCKNMGLKDYREAEIINYFKDCKAKGVTGVQWRISATGTVLYHTKGAATLYPGKDIDLNLLNENQRRVAESIKAFDPLAVAVREAKKNGIELYIWLTLSDEGSKHDKIKHLSFPDFLIKNPDCHLLDRQGKPLYGTICYSDPRAREYRLNMIKELLEYGADGLYICTRSHSFFFGNDKGDDYGFNKCIVDEYKKRYGVDILTQDFDIKKWRDLKGEGFDILIEEIGKLAHAKNQKVRLGLAYMTLSNKYLSSNWGKMTVDVEKYLRNGWIDSVVTGQYRVSADFGSKEVNRFREYARPDQKIYYWAQLYFYGQRMATALEILNQAASFNFLGANGAIMHESLNLEERPEEFFDFFGIWFNSFAK